MLRLPGLLALLLWGSTTLAAAPPPDETPVRLDTMLVTGMQPGPGLWRVESDDRVMWILGTQSPLPKRMQWRSDEVEALIARSQELLTAGYANLTTDVGMVGGLFLLPSALAARKNPDDKSLADIVPAELHARWRALKRRYLGNRKKYERWRPLFAATKLYDEAIEKSGLTGWGTMWSTIEKAAKRHKVPITRPRIELKITDARQTLKDFRTRALDDLACFELTIERLETDIDAMRARANAWAIGDLEALRELPHPNNRAACTSAVLQTDLAKAQGIDDLPRQIEAVWLEAAEKALANNALTVAVLPIESLLAPDGRLAALRARGYRVIDPE